MLSAGVVTPVGVRSIATPSYDKDVALAQDKQNDVKLQRMGEVALVKGEWKANNEMVMRSWLVLPAYNCRCTVCS